MDFNNTKILINGKSTSKSNCKGYCKSLDHEGYLDATLMRQHKCLDRPCPQFIPMESSKSHESPFADFNRQWKEGEATILKFANDCVKGKEVKFLEAKRTAVNTYKLFYIALTNDFSKDEITKKLQGKTLGKVELKQIDKSNLSEKEIYRKIHGK